MDYTQKDLDNVLNRFLNSKYGKMPSGRFNQAVNTDWKTAKAKVDWSTVLKDRNSKIDYKKFGEKRLGKSLHSKEHIQKMYKPVLQFDKQDNFITEFNSIKEAAIAMGKPGSHDIGTVCRGKQKSAYGFIWKFKEEKK
jgi:hypothetical protein